MSEFASRGSCLPKKNGQKTWKDYGLKSTKEFTNNERIDTPELLKRGKDINEATEILKKALGMNKQKIAVESPIGSIDISKSSLKHIAKDRKNSREIFGNFILPTIQNPIEIWSVEYEDNSTRKHFVALFKGNLDYLSIVRINEDGTFYLRTFILKDVNNIDDKRIGELVYKRGS